MQHGDGAQQAVFRPVQLLVRPIRGRVRRSRHQDGRPAPQVPLLPLRPIQGSHCGRAPALWGSQSPGEKSDGSGGMQV